MANSFLFSFLFERNTLTCTHPLATVVLKQPQHSVNHAVVQPEKGIKTCIHYSAGIQKPQQHWQQEQQTVIVSWVFIIMDEGVMLRQSCLVSLYHLPWGTCKHETAPVMPLPCIQNCIACTAHLLNNWQCHNVLCSSTSQSEPQVLSTPFLLLLRRAARPQSTTHIPKWLKQ